MILKNSAFICPVCGNRLFLLDRSLGCMSGHSFDKAKQGYVNLLLKNGAGKRHGDDRLMVEARSRFLDRGYYAPLRSKISDIIGSGHAVLDSGCGEGYYTSLFAQSNTVVGIDISKDALKSAAKRCRLAEFAVASISEIPLADASVDTVVNIFAPESRSEFSRILSKGGRLITATPLENHLMELKAAVYEKPYKNPPSDLKKEGFSLLSQHEVKYSITLDNNEDIQALFKMTPYYYKTSKSDQDKLLTLDSLTVRLEFLVAEYVRD